MYRNYNYVRHNTCSCGLNNNGATNACDDISPIMEHTPSNMCDCGFDEDAVFPSNPMFGHAYVPKQIMSDTLCPQAALKMGTIFPELVSPYVPMQSWMENEFLMESNEIKEGCNR